MNKDGLERNVDGLTLRSKYIQILNFDLKRFHWVRFWDKEERKQHVSFNIGTLWTFLFHVFMFKESDTSISKLFRISFSIILNGLLRRNNLLKPNFCFVLDM